MSESTKGTRLMQSLYISGARAEADRHAKEIEDAGGLAWVSADYGRDHSLHEVFWGWRIHYFSAEALARHARATQPKE